MKKRRKHWLLLLSALLCAASGVSCGGSAADGEDSSAATDTMTETVSAVSTAETEAAPVLLPAPVLDMEAIANHEKLPLWPGDTVPYAMEGEGLMEATIQAYLVEGAASCVVIFPGGGYFQLSEESEGTEIAKAYNAEGISAFVACYRYKPYDGKATLADGQRAVQFVRYYAETLGIDPEQIAVCGFSAGGHLSVMVAEHTPEENLAGDEIGAVRSTPDACILAYPVVTLGDGTYVTMPEVFLGEEQNNEELLSRYSYDYNIGAMPSTFVFYSRKDDLVDYEKNAETLAGALAAVGTKVECVAYSDGGHGVGLGKNYKEYSGWLAQSVSFLEEIGFSTVK